jgi:hypothetical protein
VANDNNTQQYNWALHYMNIQYHLEGKLTFYEYEEMFYRNAKPLKIWRNRLPLPYRTDAEIAKEDEVSSCLFLLRVVYRCRDSSLEMCLLLGGLEFYSSC